MSKRTLSPLENFKNILLSIGADIFQKEFDKLITREPIRKNMDMNVSRQKQIHPLAGSIMEALYDSIVHVPASKLFEDLKTRCEKLAENIGDKKFYIYLSHNQKHCELKSNMFLAIISMSRNPTLANNFVDFICGKTPLYSDGMEPGVTDIVYIDDVTFSGKQVMTNIDFIQDMEIEDAKIHVVIPYVTPALLTNISHHENLFLYTTETRPVPTLDAVHEIIAKHPGESVSHILRISSYLLRGNMYRPTLSLLYTDLKIADYVSIFPGFLLDPRYFDSNEPPLHIVSNCETMEIDREPVGSGNVCPHPIYKKDDWISTMKDILPGEQDDKRRKS